MYLMQMEYCEMKKYILTILYAVLLYYCNLYVAKEVFQRC